MRAMKRTLAALTFIAIMAFSSIAMATVWTDTSKDNFLFDRNHTSYSHTYKITGGADGFVPGDDIAYNGELTLNFAGLGLFEFAKISIGNLLPDFVGSFDALDHNVGLDFFALWHVNQNGKLDMTINRLAGTFTLVDSVLTVEGLDASAAPVPEPATMFLMAAGLLAIAVRRRLAS